MFFYFAICCDNKCGVCVHVIISFKEQFLLTKLERSYRRLMTSLVFWTMQVADCIEKWPQRVFLADTTNGECYEDWLLSSCLFQASGGVHSITRGSSDYLIAFDAARRLLASFLDIWKNKPTHVIYDNAVRFVL